jgi:hypothetical protein
MRLPVSNYMISPLCSGYPRVELPDSSGQLDGSPSGSILAFRETLRYYIMSFEAS